ncbi:MAG: LysR family transcriptional regulator [Planctomycetes bacterium]|nr:LysR family transcriptional regulator [Planctomycetota bacterium]
MAAELLRPRHRYKDLGLQQLRTFCAVCERGGYAPAARALSLTTPAVWEQSKGLENFLGIKLFERQGNEVRPTPEGLRLLDIVRPILAQMDSIKEVLHLESGSLPVQLNVAVASHALMRVMSPGARDFLRNYSDIVLNTSVVEADKDRNAASAEGADITLALGTDESLTLDASTGELLGVMDFLLAAPAGHPLVDRDSLRLRDLAGAPLVLGATGTFSRRQVDKVLARKGFSDRVKLVAETDGDEATLSLVAAGVGVGIVVDTAEHVKQRGLGVRSLRRWFGVARIVGLWKHGGKMPPIHRYFVDTVRAALQAEK